MAQGGTTTQQGNGLAIAGLVCGILAVLAFVLLLAFVFSVASSISTY